MALAIIRRRSHVGFAALVSATVTIPRLIAAQQMPTGQGLTLSAQLVRGYQTLQRDLVEAAEKMPEEHFGFRPTADIKPFGQLVAHVALAQFRTCAMLKGVPNPRQDAQEKASRTKTEAISLLKASTAYCDPAVMALTDPAMTEMMTIGQIQAAKGLVPVELLTHGMEMYGTMAVYLRLKGIVPPTTARQSPQMKRN